MRLVRDYSSLPGFQPQSLALVTLAQETKLLTLAYNGSTGRVYSESLTPEAELETYIDNPAALVAGSRNLVQLERGGLLVVRSAGTEGFGSAKQRIGAAARYGASGTCAATANTDAAEAIIASESFVITNNAVASPNNKLNLYNGSTGACIVGAQPAGPATTMWPVAMKYSSSQAKLFVLYHPFTGALSNAQIWSFPVTAVGLGGGQLVYNDVDGEITLLSAPPAANSASLAYFESASEKFILVGTNFGTVLKLPYDSESGLASKPDDLPFIEASVYTRAISSLIVVPTR